MYDLDAVDEESPINYAIFRPFLLDERVCALHDKAQDGVWFFILPCDWRFLPELGPPP
jgi:hypothetical protein